MGCNEAGLARLYEVEKPLSRFADPRRSGTKCPFVLVLVLSETVLVLVIEEGL